jgi:hypothetical protein
MRRLLVGAIAMLTWVAACEGSGVTTGPEEPPKPVPNFVRLESEVGDHIGQGQKLEYTQANAVITVSVLSNVIRVGVTGDEEWQGAFSLPEGASPRVGSYSGASRHQFNARSSPGLSWFGDGRRCSQLQGSFTIDSLSFMNGVPAAFDLRFEQHCEGAAPALRGTIHWRADDPTRPAGPVDPVPANLWKPDPALVPASGDYVLLASDLGEPIGQGEIRVFTAPTSKITVGAGGTHIAVFVGDYFGEFAGMVGTVPLKVGYYGNLQRLPFYNPVRGSLEWSQDERRCTRSSGWFAIDRIAYTGGILTALEMRFEQHCNGMVPALHGAIRWSR